jgi:hypothetical protein
MVEIHQDGTMPDSVTAAITEALIAEPGRSR